MNKKQKRTFGIAILIIIGLIVAGNLGFLSFLIGGNEMSCSDYGINNWKCSLASYGDIRTLESPIYFNDEFNYINVNLASPSSLDKINLLCNKMQILTGVACQPNTIPDQSWSYFITRNVPILKENLGYEVIIIEGQTGFFNNPPQITGNFKTFGLCELVGGGCEIRDPFIGDGPQLLSSNVTIYFKKGGYTLDEICSEFKLGCSNSTPNPDDIPITPPEIPDNPEPPFDFAIIFMTIGAGIILFTIFYIWRKLK